jgi:hypothetical protein
MTRQPNSRESSTGSRKSFSVFIPKIAGGGRHRNVSKLFEIKGYEVFRVDNYIKSDNTLWAIRAQIEGWHQTIEGQTHRGEPFELAGSVARAISSCTYAMAGVPSGMTNVLPDETNSPLNPKRML